MYDAQGRPAMWLPSSSLAVVNVSYSTTGQLVGLQRGSMSEKTEFDPQGRIVSRSFVDGKVWSYSYLDKVRTLRVFIYHLVAELEEIFFYGCEDSNSSAIRNLLLVLFQRGYAGH